MAIFSMKIFKGLLISLVTVILFLAVFEVTLHFIDYYEVSGPTRANVSVYDPTLGWRLKPNYFGVEKTNEFEVTYKTNELGFRGDDFVEKDKNIVFLGDSFTFGEGVEEDKIISTLIQGKLPDYEIINLGIPGYGTDQEFLLLQSFSIDHKPNIVILNYLVENIARNENQFRRLSNPSTGLDYEKPKFSLINGKLALINVPTHEPKLLDELLKNDYKLTNKDYIKKYCFSCVFFYQSLKSLIKQESNFDIYRSYYEKNSFKI